MAIVNTNNALAKRYYGRNASKHKCRSINTNNLTQYNNLLNDLNIRFSEISKKFVHLEKREHMLKFQIYLLQGNISIGQNRK